MAGNEDKRVALVPHVVSGCHDVGARIQQVLKNHFGDAKAARRVLAIHNDEVGGKALSKRWERVVDRVPARPPKTSPRKRSRIINPDRL